MCDPVGMIGLALSVGMQAANYAAQQDMVSKQNEANQAWLAYQRMKAREETARQETLRRQADASRMETLNKLSGPEQKAAQTDEQGRLEQDLSKTAGLPSDEQLAGDKLLTSGGALDMTNASPEIAQDYASQLTAASRAARERIKNLATIQSYGGSQFGLGTRANEWLTRANTDIGFAGDMRRGSLVAYGAEKGVEPLKYQMGAGAGSAAGIAQGAAGMAGKALGGALGGGIGSF